MKILAIGTSNSKHSINLALASYTASLVNNAKVESLHGGDYEMPLFSEEREQQLGKPALAIDFYQKIAEADALVISFAEHNGSYTAAWKNLFDWASRIDKKVFQNKPAVFLSTSPGPGGAASVLAAATGSAAFFGADLVDSISVPSFQDNFDDCARRINNPVIRRELEQAMQRLLQKLSDNSENRLETGQVVGF